MIAHILLLPHPEHRERLLAPGAPLMSQFGGIRLRSGGVLPVYWPGWANAHGIAWDDGRADHYMPEDRRDDAHLVLARDGAVVDEGSDRLRRVALAAGEYTPTDDDVRTLLTVADGWRTGRIGVAEWLRRMQALGTLVLIDADGREVTP